MIGLFCSCVVVFHDIIHSILHDFQPSPLDFVLHHKLAFTSVTSLNWTLPAYQPKPVSSSVQQCPGQAWLHWKRLVKLAYWLSQRRKGWWCYIMNVHQAIALKLITVAHGILTHLIAKFCWDTVEKQDSTQISKFKKLPACSSPEQAGPASSAITYGNNCMYLITNH